MTTITETAANEIAGGAYWIGFLDLDATWLCLERHGSITSAPTRSGCAMHGAVGVLETHASMNP